MFFKRVFAMIVVLFSCTTLAFTPTAEQIEQFKKLPKAQQEALAKQYGVDISSLNNVTNKSQPAEKPKPSVNPRETNVEESDSKTDELNPIKAPLKPFGYEFFAGEPTSFAPLDNLVVPESYILGVGDSISVNFYGKESYSHKLTIDNEGRLSIPNFSPVHVAGISYGELKNLIKDKIAKEAIGLNVYLSISQLRPINILVVGEAYKPGSYLVSPLSTVTHAIYASGGLSDIASLRNIQVKRSGKTISTLDLYGLLLDGNAKGNISLRSGDVVFIPSVGPQITVQGAVKREGVFELKEGDDQALLMKMFGGFRENAFTKNVTVRRIVDGAKSRIISADFSDEARDFVPKPGDKLIVKEVSKTISDSITLIGAVVRPGLYEWYAGVTVDKLFPNLRDDLLPQADYNYGIIVREKSLTGDVEVIQFSLTDALQRKNITLNKNDEIYIFSRFRYESVEQLALENLALTEAQKIQQEKVRLWHLFEYQEFEKKVKVPESALGDLSEKRAAKQFAIYSRVQLLKPVLSRLKYQKSGANISSIVEVLGQVRFPGKYPLPVNATVQDAISAAGGLLESAYREQAELTRSKKLGENKLEHYQININNESGLNMPLQSRDRLNVLMQPNWQEGYRITLAGEVAFPGTYTVNRGESLKDVIKRAGGLSEYAEPSAAIFTRQSIKKQEEEQLQKLSDELRKDIASKSFQKSIGMNNSISYDDMNKLLEDLANVQPIGRLVIDLPEIIANRVSLTVQDGDALHIPGKQESISIIGEVNYSSSHLFRAGSTIEEYLERSGGLKDRADEEKIYVIKANGSVFIPKSSGWFSVNYQNELEPGDTIVVPMDASHMDSLTLWSTATQIFYQLGVGIAALARI